MKSSQPVDLSEKIEAAFLQAAEKVLERARQTRTPVIVWKDGRIVEIPHTRLTRISLKRR
jgi:hypothetical protein